MNEQAFDKENITNEQTDNLTQSNESEEENLARELNVDDSVRGTQHLDDAMNEENEDEVAKLKAELDEAKDKYLRLVAEFDNFRRRNAKERMEMTQTAGKEIISSLLVVLDDTDRASKQMETSDDIAVVREGVMLVFNKLRATLQGKGLKKMESINQVFDADLHEAITEIPAPNADMAGKVIDEIEPGYYLNDKLIRHAKVIVGK
ncbi:MAG TPA: nucleotide exchange factor GrpE [Flavipsychrobacter sp.]|nr:nucleotide exchange factor GrpE [Flavipsychrobacter sp.]